MATLVLDPHLNERIKAERAATGADRFDEVWDGVDVMSPLANDEHQEIVAGLVTALQIVLNWGALGAVRPGVNVSDREEDWTHNYRIPDVAVFLQDTTARNLGTHWLGGPDFAVEIASPGDQTREKLPFYADAGTRELLLIDRSPWMLELYALRDGALQRVGTSSPDRPEPLASAMVPLSFRLVAGEPRPRIEVVGAEHRWAI